jgi:thiol:disulfide interchange protein
MKSFTKLLKQTVFLVLLFIAGTAAAQILEPVKWSFSHEKTADNQYELRFTATIDQGWNIYGTDLPDGGPIATSIEIKEGNGFRKVGSLRYPKPVEKFDPNFNMQLSMFSGSVTFRQTVEVTSERPVSISGEVGFMSCDDKSCLPPDYIDFSFELPGKTHAAASVSESTSEDTVAEVTEDTEASSEGEMLEEALVDEEIPVTEKTGRGKGWFWGTFITGVLGGLLALLTPCVFPMIPLTVSFFLRNAGNRPRAIRDASFYGLTIIFAYACQLVNGTRQQGRSNRRPDWSYPYGSNFCAGIFLLHWPHCWHPAG